jgi:hypothetical protein
MIRVHLALIRWGMVLADHVAIDISLLRETSGRLGRVTETLGGARGTAHADADAVAHPDLADAVRQFADNWRTHREHLVDQVSGGQKFVTGAADAYERLDQQLASALNTDQGAGMR